MSEIRREYHEILPPCLPPPANTPLARKPPQLVLILEFWTITMHDPRTDRRPAPQEARVQAFSWTSLSLGWYLSLLWGFIYASDVAHNKGVNGIWTGTGIKLFNIKASANGGISLRSPKGAVDAVGNTIAQRLGSFSFTTNSLHSASIRDV